MNDFVRVNRIFSIFLHVSSPLVALFAMDRAGWLYSLSFMLFYCVVIPFIIYAISVVNSYFVEKSKPLTQNETLQIEAASKNNRSTLRSFDLLNRYKIFNQNMDILKTILRVLLIVFIITA